MISPFYANEVLYANFKIGSSKLGLPDNSLDIIHYETVQNDDTVETMTPLRDSLFTDEFLAAFKTTPLGKLAHRLAEMNGKELVSAGYPYNGRLSLYGRDDILVKTKTPNFNGFG